MSEPTPMESAAPEAVEPAPRRPGVLRLAFMAAVVLGTFAALAYAGIRARDHRTADREAMTVTTDSSRPRVLTVVAERSPAKVEQVLPASAAPLLETALYARTTGYLKARYADIGDRVTEGQLLAEIETPELDAQLLQARAALIEQRATLVRSTATEHLAQVNLARVKPLAEGGAASRQEFDEADAALRVAAANVKVADAAIKASEANVRRLEELQHFQKVTAPFAGVVTVRNYDAGALIVADSATARELFHVAKIDTLRVFADVPQIFATALHPGLAAPVFRREVPGREYPGTVTRTTQSVDPLTRTLRVQVDVANPDGALLPGMFLQVRFRLDAVSVVRVPGAAVVTRADGAKVAVLGAGNAVTYRGVKLGRDFGTVVEVVDGLSGGETLVVRPGDDIPAGTVVEPVPTTDR